ncbi:MAG: DUF192 domain-containing protein [Rhodomicrobium sp.]
MGKGHKNARAALAALFILGFLQWGAAVAPPAYGDVLFKRASLKIETSNGPALLNVEVADTDRTREQGLMFRRAVADRAGMIFLFDDEQEITMWMKNTYIPLDMVFIGNDWRIVNIAYDAEPFSTDVISSGRPASRVLEIGAGQAKKLGLAIGDAVSLQTR